MPSIIEQSGKIEGPAKNQTQKTQPMTAVAASKSVTCSISFEVIQSLGFLTNANKPRRPKRNQYRISAHNLRKLAEKHVPPQSWYEEDFDPFN